MIVTPLGIDTVVNDVQLKNARLPMLVTLLGIEMDISPLQPENASDSIVVTEFGMTKSPDFPGGKLIKVFFPFEYKTPSLDSKELFWESTTMELKLVHPTNASDAICETFRGMVIVVNN